MEQKVDIVVISPKEFLKIDKVANLGWAVRTHKNSRPVG